MNANGGGCEVTQDRQPEPDLRYLPLCNADLSIRFIFLILAGAEESAPQKDANE